MMICRCNISHNRALLRTSRPQRLSSVTRSQQDAGVVSSIPHHKFKNIGPPPAKFTPAEGQLVDLAGASLPTALRLGTGLFNVGYSAKLEEDDDKSKYSVLRFNSQRITETSTVSFLRRPEKLLELYEFEGCPFCKKVREAVTILDLDVIVRPCPRDGTTWRPQAIQIGGKSMFPFLVDPNTGNQMYESDDIIKYLFSQYGPGQEEIPFLLRAGFLTTLTCGLGLVARSGHGNKALTSRIPEQLLRMWMYEGSPFVKIVREVLCELEIPYLQITTGRGSPKRQQMMDTYGTFQVPFLEDPNAGVCMFESKAIIEYLRQTYGGGT
ncbi:hypothetical protein CEUSTIGMA_g1948.t1 [Chlamydomonas eustigma]|uniref:GST N-terminal domain-containing protein n=1 Tax=Chlamydomonas eustigma TaxID=1157962 RepID=A0A250WUW3_9CHLO|nr:hypothetical protein CEUSTIGMA_g1948.t1 [Chlamydomonas eustigma]|eukprot:GAX74499.1 hypothetical protein CEUSTIGMA_g1948.t1 [Chlamydomonas eustigma]